MQPMNPGTAAQPTSRKTSFSRGPQNDPYPFLRHTHLCMCIPIYIYMYIIYNNIYIYVVIYICVCCYMYVYSMSLVICQSRFMILYPLKCPNIPCEMSHTVSFLVRPIVLLHAFLGAVT